MRLLIISALLLSVGAKAQTETGIHFEHNTSWADLKARAKAENKYVFVDAFTTWCGPCKWMAKEIFPKPEVGEFFNANFINLKLQLDTTKNDNEEVKKMYQDAHNLMVDYKVNVFPTYLFFSPNGELVHRAVGSSEAADFIAKAKNALNPVTQYYPLKAAYLAGKKDPATLLALTKAAQEAYDRELIPVVTKEYLATQTDLTTDDNIKLLASSTEKTTDPGFTIFLNQAAKADKVLGRPGTSDEIIEQVLLRDVVAPAAFAAVKKGAEPNWAAAQEKLKSYPRFADKILYRTQASYYQRNKNWPAFKTAVANYIVKAKVSEGQLNSFAWAIFENCDDQACIKAALDWSKKSLTGSNAKNAAFMDTYANLLHKSGKKALAVKAEQQVIALVKAAKEDASPYEATLEKMKKGEPTW